VAELRAAVAQGLVVQAEMANALARLMRAMRRDSVGPEASMYARAADGALRAGAKESSTLALRLAPRDGETAPDE